MQSVVGWDMGTSLFGLRLPPDKATTVMTDHLLTGLSCLGKVVQVESYIHKPEWLSWVVISEAYFGCHDILILGKVP